MVSGTARAGVPLPVLPDRVGEFFQKEGITLRPGQELLFQRRGEGRVAQHAGAPPAGYRPGPAVGGRFGWHRTYPARAGDTLDGRWSASGSMRLPALPRARPARPPRSGRSSAGFPRRGRGVLLAAGEEELPNGLEGPRLAGLGAEMRERVGLDRQAQQVEEIRQAGSGSRPACCRLARTLAGSVSGRSSAAIPQYSRSRSRMGR